MLILTRKENETINIGENISIKIVEIRPGPEEIPPGVQRLFRAAHSEQRSKMAKARGLGALDRKKKAAV